MTWSCTLSMHPSDRIETVTHLAAPLAASLGLEIWGVEIAGSTRPLVRLYVDVPASPPADAIPADDAPDGAPVEETSATAPGVTIDQCAELSRLLGLSLDVENLFASGWTLEVSSPGLERPFFRLDQLSPYLGREIEVTLSSPLEAWTGRKKFCGVLARVADESFTLHLPLAPVARRREDEPESADIPWSVVRKATLIHIFPEPGLKKGGSGN